MDGLCIDQTEQEKQTHVCMYVCRVLISQSLGLKTPPTVRPSVLDIVQCWRKVGVEGEGRGEMEIGWGVGEGRGRGAGCVSYSLGFS